MNGNYCSMPSKNKVQKRAVACVPSWAQACFMEPAHFEAWKSKGFLNGWCIDHHQRCVWNHLNQVTNQCSWLRLKISFIYIHILPLLPIYSRSMILHIFTRPSVWYILITTRPLWARKKRLLTELLLSLPNLRWNQHGTVARSTRSVLALDMSWFMFWFKLPPVRWLVLDLWCTNKASKNAPKQGQFWVKMLA